MDLALTSGWKDGSEWRMSCGARENQSVREGERGREKGSHLRSSSLSSASFVFVSRGRLGNFVCEPLSLPLSLESPDPHRDSLFDLEEQRKADFDGQLVC
jgi:hypothetical protein